MNAARLVAVALVVAVPGTSRADDATPASLGFDAPFRLFVNSVDKGDVNVVLLDADVLVDVEDLKAGGIAAIGGRVVEREGRRLLSLRSVSPPLRYELDDREIALRIFAPAELLPLTIVDLQAAPPGIVYTRDTSAFLNYGAQLTDTGHMSLYEEMGLSFDTMLLQSSATFSSSQPPVRGLSRLTIEDRPTLTRTTFGDVLVGTGPLGGGALLGGAAVSRTYELDPYALKVPGLGFSGSTVTPATLEVYMNGSRVHSEAIPPGTFELQNFFPRGGTGTATYIVRDAFGHEQEFSQPFYSSSQLLRSGAEEYTYAMGIVRRDLATDSWGYERPAAVGTHRVGIEEWFTGGGRFEVMEARASLGPSLTLVTPAGQLDVDVSGSVDTVGAGFAAQVAHSYSSPRFTGGVYARTMTHEYTTLDMEPEEDRAVLDIGLGFGVPIARVVTFSYRTSVASFRDRGLVAQIDGRISTELLTGLSWSFGGRHVARRQGENDWALTTMFAYGLGGGHRASVTGQLESGHPSATAELSKSITQAEDYGYRALGTLDDPMSANLSAQYQASAGRYTLRYNLDQQRDLNVGAAGALIVVPGVGIFPSLPVQSSFGVIRMKGVQGVRGYGNGQEVGSTDRNGNLIVPNLLANYGNRLSVDPESIPVDYELQAADLLLGPPARGVAIADFTLTQPHYFRGVLLVEVGGQRVPPKYGELQVLDVDPPLLSPLGANGEFELEGLPAGRHRARIDYEGGLCELALEIPEGEGPVIELGTITCVQAPSEMGPHR